jgi:hypothetical protein
MPLEGFLKGTKGYRKGREMRKISITLTVRDEAKTLFQIPASNLIKYEPARSVEATLVVYTDAVDAVRTVLVRESPVEIARLVWAALRPGPIHAPPNATKVG